MSFDYRDGVLHAEDVSFDDLAQRFGTPCYVYSRAAIEQAYRAYADALAGCPSLVCYSVKSNSNLAVLALLARLGAGFDIVSGGELARVLAAGGAPQRIVFSGVGKTEAEIAAALQAGILCINVESEPELERIDAVAARLGRKAPIAFRVNPDIDARTHPYTSTGLKGNKFGVPHRDVETLYARAASLRNVAIRGIGCHIGSQLADTAPIVAAAERLAALAAQVEAGGIALEHFDIGGGAGIRYRDEVITPVGELIAAVRTALGDRKGTLIVDPGRSIVGNAGVLLTRIEYLKQGEEKNFLIADAAMNDLLRPSLYGAWHEVRAVREPKPGQAAIVCDVVGPVCESGDFLAKDRALAAGAGDLLAIGSAGAYGMTMSSNYNSRPRVAEILVDGTRAHLIRERESVESLFALELIPPL